MRNVAFVAWVFSLLAGSPAQEPTPKATPTRSLAAGLVRQQIEIDKIGVPLARSGDEMGAGKGPMVLMVRRADGSLQLHELQRGDGDHGPAAEPTVPPLEQELVEKHEELPEAKDYTRIVLGRRGNDQTIGTAAKLEAVVGKQLDHAVVTNLLQAQRAGKNERMLANLMLEAAPEVTMQEILTVWEVARGLGWKAVMFHIDPGKSRPLAAAESEVIGGLASKHAWQVERIGPNQPVCSGELLVMLAGDTRWGDVRPLLVEFARNGIWELGFVAKKDDKTWVKLPTHLPFDRGR
jgi:hypothetical protein